MESGSVDIVEVEYRREIPIVRVLVGGVPIWVRQSRERIDRDLSAARPIVEHDEYELRPIWSHHGESIQTIVDVGAHVGTFTLFATSLFPRARVIAIEPDPESAAICRVNFRGKSNIRFFESATTAGGPDTVHLGIRIDMPGHAASNFVVEQGNTHQPELASDNGVTCVKAARLSDILAASGIEVIDILKVDCEGGETDVFEDLALHGWLERVRWIRGEWHGTRRLHRLTELLSTHHCCHVEASHPSLGHFIAHHKTLT